MILSRGGAAEALEWTALTMARIGLTLKRGKTKLVQAKHERFNFLGYTFGPHRFKKDGHGYWGASPSTKSVARLRRKVQGVCASERSGALGGGPRPAQAGIGGLVELLLLGHPAEGVSGGGQPRVRASARIFAAAEEGVVARHPAVQRPGGVRPVRRGAPAPDAPGSAACDSLREEAVRRAGCGKSARPVR